MSETNRIENADIEDAYRKAVDKAIADYKLRDLPDEQLRVLSNACLDELARRYTIETAKTRIDQAANDYAQAVADVAPRKITEITAADVLGPGERFIDSDGTEWINQSGAWLQPRTAGPDQYPAGWRKAKAPAANAGPPWKPCDKVNAGDLRAYEGVVYKCLQAHTTQAGWEPGKVPALWVIA